MSKIIITNIQKTEFEPYQVLNCSADFSVIEKNPDKFQIFTNTDNGLVTIELNKEDLKQLLNKIQETLR
ncbi:hypothetical protein [Chryseobacterium cheonjiense]|uniref:Uncharacterized protein n=1 Tax=Chryseobacterium cheonjiense TaxID=2728845 RepID=A0A7Y0FGX5_9FLAO|nr:hypothetical protein [Chryseobacterium cheonjiense]NML55823.1 hypothetical protein [Chryseobacterium cheonjiense]